MTDIDLEAVMGDYVPEEMVTAKVILDSYNDYTFAEQRLTTIEVTFNRFVLAEFNTHRIFSRNSASSRAIPFPKQVERVSVTPAMPLVWATEQKGMQGGEPLTGQQEAQAIARWLMARDSALEHAQYLADLGVHKSIVNRLLEPFMWHTVIVSATEWDGFWKQRCSPLAQPEIRIAAEKMREAYDASVPLPLRLGEYHMPYLRAEDWEEAATLLAPDGDAGKLLAKVSVARCARVSYLTHDGHRSLQADLDLYERLVRADPMHASPLEHVATPATSHESTLGNFRGWHQLRHAVEFATDDTTFFRRGRDA